MECEYSLKSALGGSVTEGAGPQNFRDGYAYQFCRKLNASYTSNNGEKVHVAYAGLSGTPSSLGLTRYESDVVQRLGHLPDLLIIEFAVNDEGDETKGDCYESLVRKVLNLPWKPAVILLFSVFANDWNLQDRLSPVGKLYDTSLVKSKKSAIF